MGTLDLIDNDRVSLSNINRQIIALHSTVGELKVDAAAARVADISPDTQVNRHCCFFLPETADLFDFSLYDYVIDAIDTIQPKVALLAACIRRRQPVIASMGAGAKTDITAIQYADIWQTYHCGLSKSVRSGLARAGLCGRKLPVVFCAQQADRRALLTVEGERNKKTTAGTVSFMPATFGNYLAAWVLNRL